VNSQLASGYLIDIFPPPVFVESPLDLDLLLKLTGKNYRYASMGRHALFHLLKSQIIQGPLLLPAYLCKTVLDSVRRLDFEVVFYDIDPVDLNASIESIDFLASKYNCDALVVASMYGNPADMINIERYCADSNIVLIDDAAQSYGATLYERAIGTFGDGGFFSFSPGKPTSGHMGAFYWLDRELVSPAKTKHELYHRLTYYDFFFNRLHRDKYYGKIFTTLIKFLQRGFSKIIDVTNDDICDFEKVILGGILRSQLNGCFNFQKIWANEFFNRFKDNDVFRVVKATRGVPHPHKLVVVFNKAAMAQSFMVYLAAKGFFSLNGYSPLSNDYRYLPNLEKLRGCVVEMPIVDSEMKMAYLFDTIAQFVSG
jgi:hypothetical protein